VVERVLVGSYSQIERPIPLVALCAGTWDFDVCLPGCYLTVEIRNPRPHKVAIELAALFKEQ
jgi:hypothetical protein